MQAVCGVCACVTPKWAQIGHQQQWGGGLLLVLPGLPRGGCPLPGPRAQRAGVHCVAASADEHTTRRGKARLTHTSHDSPSSWLAGAGARVTH
jgi:hypothetical protein